MNKSLQTLLLGAGIGGAFLLGQLFPRGVDGEVLDAQGRGPINPPPAPVTQPVQPDQPAPIVYSEDGGGSTTGTDLDLTESHERRLRAMAPLNDGRWNTSSLEDLPKAEAIGRWIREAIPGIAGG